MIMFGQNNGGEDRFTPTRNLEGVRHGWSPQTPRRRCFIRIFIALTKVLMLSFTDLRVCIMWPLIYQSIKHCSWLDKPWYTCCSALESASVCEKNIKTGNYTVVHGRTDVRTLLLTRAPRDNTWDTAGRSSTSDATASMTILLARRPSWRRCHTSGDSVSVSLERFVLFAASVNDCGASCAATEGILWPCEKKV